MAAKQQHSRFGLPHEYPLASAASFSNPNKKWALNAKNDVVEVYPPQFNDGGFMSGECGRLMRYNSAPSCLFSDLDQIARSLNDNPFTGNNSASSAEHLPPLPVKNTVGPTTSRFSGHSSVSLGMDFREDQQNNNGNSSLNGFTSLLTSSDTTPVKKKKHTGRMSNLNNSPASLISRLEIEHHTGSSEEDSPLIRSPTMNEQQLEDHVMDLGVSSTGVTTNVVDCGFWDSNGSAMPAVHQHLQNSVYGWNSDSVRKRGREVDLDIADAAVIENNQQQHTLTRHLSLPISTRGGLLGTDNLLPDSVPCRLRAKRGCATHPRSIAERVRRTRISERLRRLQELVPNMDKQTNMSDMLDEAADYMKALQRRVEELEDCREKCCRGLCKASRSAASGSPIQPS